MNSVACASARTTQLLDSPDAPTSDAAFGAGCILRLGGSMRVRLPHGRARQEAAKQRVHVVVRVLRLQALHQA